MAENTDGLIKKNKARTNSIGIKNILFIIKITIAKKRGVQMFFWFFQYMERLFINIFKYLNTKDIAR